MKKIVILLAAAAALMLSSAVSAKAEGLIVKGGLTYTSASTVQELKNGKSGWEFGAGFQTETFSGLSLQPELLYKVKGVTLSDATKVDMNYLELPVNVQWGIDLLIARPFIFASPFIGCNLGTKFSKESDLAATVKESVQKFEYGFGAGIGLDLFKFQITAKYNWNFGKIASWGDYKEKISGLDPAAGTIEIALGLKF